MRATVKKCGNSASVRIPAAVLQAAHLDLDHPVNVREEAGRIIIEPLQRKKFDLPTLLEGITQNNVHCEADFGARAGREVSYAPGALSSSERATF